MGKRRLKNVDELELRLWHCEQCKDLACEITSYMRPVECNIPETKEKESVPKWHLVEVL